MRQILIPHPDSLRPAASRIEVEAARPWAGELILRYVVTGATGGLVLPAPARPERADGLWRHTCLEAFARSRGDGYHEFNFAPSGKWAAYGFSGYRQGMADAGLPAPPRTELATTGEGFELTVALALPSALASADLRLGLSAVIEAADGGVSYWALAHGAGKPDFHHPDCFRLELPATGRP